MAENVVMVVDDDLDNCTLLSTIVESLLGVPAVQAHTGREALERIEQSKPALIVLDMVLPDIDGSALVRHLRGDQETRDLPIIALTGLYSALEEALRAGCSEYIQKPFELDYFLSRVEHYLIGRDSPKIC